jgi:hypothetical protein
MFDPIWVTKDGKRLRVSQMTTSHIINCINKIQRHMAHGKPWRTEYLERLNLELELRALK